MMMMMTIEFGVFGGVCLIILLFTFEKDRESKSKHHRHHPNHKYTINCHTTLSNINTHIHLQPAKQSTNQPTKLSHKNYPLKQKQ